MAMAVLASDKGSPGVTTTAVTMAAVWPRRAVLAELDPSGGDVALRLRGPRRTPLSPERGLISLAIDIRRGIGPHQVLEHVQRLDGGLEVILGLSSAEQAGGLGGLWSPVGELLGRLAGIDVVADVGRLYPGSPALDLLRHAAAVVLVARPSVEGVAHLRSRADSLLRELDRQSAGAVPVCCVVVTHPRDSSSPGEVDLVLRRSGLPVAVLGRIAHDPKGAGMLCGEWVGKLDKSLLVRSTREVAGRVADRLVASVTG
jgi:hypothetical protein